MAPDDSVVVVAVFNLGVIFDCIDCSSELCSLLVHITFHHVRLNLVRSHIVVDEHGGTAYIPFKETATGKTGSSPVWRKMYHKFQLDNDECRQRYQKRSNVETTFQMLKTKFGDSVNAKNEQAQLAETRLKILCHNVVVVIHAIRESDIHPGFLSGELEASSELIR